MSEQFSVSATSEKPQSLHRHHLHIIPPHFPGFSSRRIDWIVDDTSIDSSRLVIHQLFVLLFLMQHINRNEPLWRHHFIRPRFRS